MLAANNLLVEFEQARDQTVVASNELVAQVSLNFEHLKAQVIEQNLSESLFGLRPVED